MTTVRWKILFPLLAMVILGSVEISRANHKNSSYYLPANTSVLSRYNIVDNINDTLKNEQQIIVDAMEAVEEEDGVDYNLIAPSYESHLVKSSIIYGLAKTVNASSVNRECYRHLRNVQKGILRKEPWAMKALDASGSKPSGFVFGQNFWFGSKEACGAVRRPVGITLSENYPRVMKLGIIKDIAPFEMDYRVVYLRHNSPWQVEIKLMSEQIIHIGLCLPSSCGSDEIQQLMSDYVNEGLFVENDIYDIQPEVLYMKDLKISENFFERESFKLISVFIAFILAMILIASYLRAQSKEVANKMENVQDDQADTNSNQNITEINLSNYPRIRNFIMCFDVQENFAKMCSTKESKPSEIPVINGLRSVCALWILVFHVVWYMYFTVNNKTFLISYAEKVFFQYVSSAPVLVDVFFTVSGFLQTYNFLRNKEKMELIRKNSFLQNTKQFFKMFSHRYLRLGPLYLVVMAIVDLLFAYISKVSVYHINERFDENCANYWWRNIFFIQNLYDHKDMCLNWTWSLACEMQYFVIATILLFTYTKHPKMAKTLTIACFIANVVWSFSIGLNNNFQLSFDTFFATGTDIYISPFVRVLPYIMGAAAGWYFLEHKNRQFDLSEFQEKCLWNLSILTFFICIYSTIKRDMSYIMAISLFVVGRFLFSLSICWMIIGSATGRSSSWSRFLEAKPFQHLNRLSYAIYLLNPFVIALFFGLTSVSTHADPFMLCVLCSGFSIITYLASIVFSLAFEMPFCNWSTLILKGQTDKLKNA